MHAKHRPGNGYRSNAMGMGGVAAASRISPEGSMRGHRMYSSDNRNYNRGGYGRGGHSKQVQPPQPPPREADIFMEAGRLAAEYLISKGVLPPNALSGKWQSDGFKNQRGNFQGFRSQEIEKTQISGVGRTSVHSRLGNPALDVGQGRRKYSDEYNSFGLRTSMRGKRSESLINNGSEMHRDLGRSGSWAEKSRDASAMDVDSDASVGHHDERTAGKDCNVGLQNSPPGEATQETDSDSHLESRLEKRDLVEDADANNSTLNNEKYSPSDADREPMKMSVDANKFDNEAKEVGEGRNDNNLQHDENKEPTASTRVDDLVSADHVDLVKHCKFVNVPTRARSSLTTKGKKSDQHSMNKDENISRSRILENSDTRLIDVEINRSAGSSSSHQTHEFKSIQSDGYCDQTVEKEPDETYPTQSRQLSRSASLAEKSVFMEQEQDQGLSGFGRSNSMLVERGEKRAIDYKIDAREDNKRIRQWVPLLDAQSDSSPHKSSSNENQPVLQEPTTTESVPATLSPEQRGLNVPLFPKNHVDSCEFMEEKQLFPASFKTCDLNLVGNCDTSETRNTGPGLVFQSVMHTEKVATPVDIDLSISNNCNLPSKNGKHGVNDNDIEVIDLEKDSAQEDKTYTNPARRVDTVFTDLDGFPNNVHNANGVPDVQDGYGLMISELLGNESPNCSSVPTDLNSLHNHMGLPNTEGILGDDDSIYMSLGEIPISLLGPWEQPTQDYGKPF